MRQGVGTEKLCVMTSMRRAWLCGALIVLGCPSDDGPSEDTDTDATGTVRTITDTGFGVLTGSLDPAYATVVGGLGANRVDYTTGAINLRAALAVMRGTLVVATYKSRAASTVLRTVFGDTTAGFTFSTTSAMENGAWAVATSGADCAKAGVRLSRRAPRRTSLASSARSRCSP